MPDRREAATALRRLLDKRLFNEFLRGRAVVILFIFFIQAWLLFIVVNLPFLPGEQERVLQTVNGTASSIQGQSIPAAVGLIFLNNLHVAISGVSPVLGQFYFLLATYNTARAVEVIGLLRSTSPDILILYLYSLPHTWIETSAYALATTEACYLFWVIVRGRGKESWWDSLADELAYIPPVLVMILVVLMVAAIFEVLEGHVPGDPQFLFWIPCALGCYLVIRSGLLAPVHAAPADGGAAKTGPPLAPPWREKLRSDIEARVTTDRSLSARWMLIPAALLASYYAYASYVTVAVVRTVLSSLGNGTYSPSLPDLTIAAYIYAVAYTGLFVALGAFCYFLIRRRNLHFAREHAFYEDVLAALEARAGQVAHGPDFELRLSQARRSVDEMKGSESRKDPLVWAVVIAVVTPLVVFAYYFLMKEFARHERRENKLLTELSSASYSIGVNLGIGRPRAPVQERSFAFYAILTIITGGLFWLYWNYRLIRDPEEHFPFEWDIEDGIYTSLEGNASLRAGGVPPAPPDGGP